MTPSKPGANFTWREFTRSSKATELGISNEPSTQHAAAIVALCKAVLDPLREALGRSVNITSGYRSPKLNAAIRGSSTSQHMVGEAADIKVDGMPAEDLAAYIVRLGLPFDQVIWYAVHNGGQVHVSHKAAGRNRGQTLYSPAKNVYRAWAPA